MGGESGEEQGTGGWDNDSVCCQGLHVLHIPAIRERLDCWIFMIFSHREAKYKSVARLHYEAEAKEGSDRG